MHELFKEIRAVGFDLDGTLYQAIPKMDDRIRNNIAEKILQKKPELKNVYYARDFFEKRYKDVQSGSKILEEAGYNNSSVIMDRCIAEADVLDLINPNPKLNEILNEMINSKDYLLYLITSSFRDLALKKLDKIGVKYGLFTYSIFGDSIPEYTKTDGLPFEMILDITENEANEYVYIGDRLKSDILPPKKLGMKTIAVWNKIPEADLSIEHINDIGDLLL